MPSAAATASNIRQRFSEALADAKESSAFALEQIITPTKLQKAADGATRTGQVIAAVVLGPVIMVSLVIIRVINDLMTSVLGAGDFGAADTSAAAFIITFLTLGILIIFVWGWFQFVRTAAFGGFNFND